MNPFFPPFESRNDQISRELKESVDSFNQNSPPWPTINLDFRDANAADALREFIDFADSIIKQASVAYSPESRDPGLWQRIGFPDQKALKTKLDGLKNKVIATSAQAWDTIHKSPDEMDRMLHSVVWNLIQLPTLAFEREHEFYVGKYTTDAHFALENLRPLLIALSGSANTTALEDPALEEYSRFCELHALASSPGTHRVSLPEFREYQRLLAKYGGIYKVDGVIVGPPDPTRALKQDDILNSDVVPIIGKKPLICPRSSPKLPLEILPDVETRFRSCGLVNADETILWVGRQASMETVCGYRNGCTCFATASSVPQAESQQPDVKLLPPKKAKQSTQPEEARAKLITALLEHHHYATDTRLNLIPIGNNQLASAAGVSKSSASEFFKKEFKGYSKYRAVCRNEHQLLDSLKILNDDYSPHQLYGRRPPNEDDRDKHYE